jgi:hypothetical protein
MNDERSAEYWVSLIGKLTRCPEVADVLVRHAVSLDGLQWIHGSARAGLHSAGVYIYFWKAGSGREVDVQIMGVAFAMGGLRRGYAYQGSLPDGIDLQDAVEAVRGKLAHVAMTEANGPGRFEASFADHRLVVAFDAKGSLTSCPWFPKVELRRIPKKPVREH